jgi:hypothetical protein
MASERAARAASVILVGIKRHPHGVHLMQLKRAYLKDMLPLIDLSRATQLRSWLFKPRGVAIGVEPSPRATITTEMKLT